MQIKTVEAFIAQKFAGVNIVYKEIYAEKNGNLLWTEKQMEAWLQTTRGFLKCNM